MLGHPNFVPHIPRMYVYQVRHTTYFRQWRHSGVQDMYKQTQVADVVLMTSVAVNGVGPEIVKCYRDSTAAVQQYRSNRV